MKQRILGLIIFIIGLVIFGLLGYNIYFYSQSKYDYSFEGIELQHDHNLSVDFISEKEQAIYEKLENVETRNQLKDYYYGLGYLKFFLDEYELSNEWFLKALEINSYWNHDLQAMLMVGVSNNYYLLSNELESDKYYQMAIDVAMKNYDDELLARIFRSRASLYMNRFESLDHAARLINFARYLETDTIFQAECEVLMAQIYMINQDYPMMYQSLQQAWIGAMHYEETDLLTEINFLSAIAYFLSGHYQQAIECVDYFLGQQVDQYREEMLLILGYSQYYLEGYDSAIQVLNQYQSEMSGNINYYQLAKVGLLVNEGRHEEANYLLQQVKSTDATRHLETIYHLVLSEAFGTEINWNKEYQQILDEFKSFSKYSLTDFIFNGLNDRSIRANTDIDESLMLDEYLLLSKQSSDLKTENLSLNELYQLIYCKQLKTEQMQQNFLVISIALIVLFLGRSIYFSYHKRQLKSQLNFQKTRDPLTQTLTYESVDEEIRILKGSQCEIQLILFDIKSLQKYNDTYGYLAGNQVIKRAAYLLRNDFPNAWISRYSSHRFLVAMIDTDESVDDRIMNVMKDFEDLNIQCVTDLSSRKLLLMGSGACYTLTKDFNLDECIKVLEQQLKLMK